MTNRQLVLAIAVIVGLLGFFALIAKCGSDAEKERETTIRLCLEVGNSAEECDKL